jgi:hypothetical protein
LPLFLISSPLFDNNEVPIYRIIVMTIFSPKEELEDYCKKIAFSMTTMFNNGTLGET